VKSLLRTKLLMVLILITPACDAPTGQRTDSTPWPLPTTVTAVDKLDLGLQGKDAAFLSPDGQFIATTSGSASLCIFSASGQKKQCWTKKDGPKGVDPSSVRWSPDSKHLAFTENFLRDLNESDIWVLDVSTLRLADLTDDQVDGPSPFLTASETANTDVAPCWSKEGKELAFIRYLHAENTYESVLFTVDVEGGMVQRAATLDVSPASFIAAWSPDSKRIAYNIGVALDDPETGLRLASLDGHDATQRLQTSTTLLYPTDLQFSADGRYVAAFGPMMRYSEPYDIDVDTDRVIEVAGSGVRTIEEEGAKIGKAHRATWAPSGSTMAYLVSIAKDKSRSGLYVTPQPGAPGIQVYAGEFTSPGGDYRTIIWASNNTILVEDVSQPGNGALLLLHLGTAP